MSEREELPHADKPLYRDSFHVCNCSADEVKPAKKEIEYKAQGGGTAKIMRYWCMTCGLTLRFRYIDVLQTEEWKDTRHNPPAFIEDKEEDKPFDPLT